MATLILAARKLHFFTLFIAQNIPDGFAGVDGPGFEDCKGLSKPIVMPLLLPIFALISVLVRLTSAGPVFYRETRMGRLQTAKSSNYEYPADVMSLLDQAGRVAVMSAMILVQAIEGSADVMSPKVETLQRRFNQLRSSYGA